MSNINVEGKGTVMPKGDFGASFHVPAQHRRRQGSRDTRDHFERRNHPLKRLPVAKSPKRKTQEVNFLAWYQISCDMYPIRRIQ